MQKRRKRETLSEKIARLTRQARGRSTKEQIIIFRRAHVPMFREQLV